VQVINLIDNIVDTSNGYSYRTEMGQLRTSIFVDGFAGKYGFNITWL